MSDLSSLIYSLGATLGSWEFSDISGGGGGVDVGNSDLTVFPLVSHRMATLWLCIRSRSTNQIGVSNVNAS